MVGLGGGEFWRIVPADCGLVNVVDANWDPDDSYAQGCVLTPNYTHIWYCVVRTD
jgi:hypothetical protein